MSAADDARITAAFAAVLAAPGDLAPRRAYADAVRASDPDRAALIDAQLAIREARRAGQSPVLKDELAARDLVRKHGSHWCGPIASAVESYDFWGGFVEEVRATAAQFTDVADTALRGFVPLRMLRLTKVKGHLPAVLAEPILAQLVSLDVGESELTDADIQAIAATPALRGLVVLRIAGNTECGYASLRALAALPALRFVDADFTRTPLRITIQDGVDGSSSVDFTAAQERMESELGKLPWLEALVRPSNHAL